MTYFLSYILGSSENFLKQPQKMLQDIFIWLLGLRMSIVMERYDRNLMF